MIEKLKPFVLVCIMTLAEECEIDKLQFPDTQQQVGNSGKHKTAFSSIFLKFFVGLPSVKYDAWLRIANSGNSSKGIFILLEVNYATYHFRKYFCSPPLLTQVWRGILFVLLCRSELRKALV